MKTIEQAIRNSLEIIRMAVPARRTKHEEVETRIVSLLGARSTRRSELVL